jgi:SAM-dependent methyltransferase
MDHQMPLGEHAERAALTYGSAADHYTWPALSFWDRFGAEIVSRLRLRQGDAVADLCCGAGASAIPAARAVGATGRVVAVGVAAPLLRAAREGLTTIELRHADATRSGLPSRGFDAVVCAFGVFFAADMPAFVAEMWRLVRVGGTLAVTTWGAGLFEPASGLFWEAVRQAEPSLFKAFNPWDEITSVPALVDLFARAGISHATAQAVPGRHHLDHPDDFWDVVLGSGYRATIDALSGEQIDTVRDRLLRALRSSSITTLQTDVIFGTAIRPHDDPF